MLSDHILWERRAFYLFLVCFSLLPLSFPLFSPILFIIYAACALYFLLYLRHAVRKPAIAGSVVLLYIGIYVVYGIYSLILGQAERTHIFKDSVGFLFYPAYFPLVALIIAGRIDQHGWERFLILLGVAISVFHFIAFATFYYWNEVLTSVTLFSTNQFLRGIGTASKYATGNGLLRVDSCMGTLLIIPMMLAVRRIVVEEFTWKHYVVVSILASGLLLEGHRALMIAVIVGLFSYLLWFACTTKSLTRLLICAAGTILSVAAGLFVTFAMLGNNLNMGLVAERFSESVKIDTARTDTARTDTARTDTARADQIGPLIEKITESPLIGSGFGVHASMIRNVERPFMYEMDYLAIIMKLGFLGGGLYFGGYLYLLYLGVKSRKDEPQKMSYFFAGLSFFIFAGTNGGMAMSVYSTLFHLYLMLGLSMNYKFKSQVGTCKTSSI